MMSSIGKRIKKLEDLEVQYRAESGPNPAAILLERRRKFAIAEGREPEPDPPPVCLIDSEGRRIALSDVLLKRRENERRAMQP
jgi:hypothetical protein